jgi:hypothetical protein
MLKPNTHPIDFDHLRLRAGDCSEEQEGMEWLELHDAILNYKTKWLNFTNDEE